MKNIKVVDIVKSLHLTVFFCTFKFQRQPAFDSFESVNALFMGYFPSLNEDQTVQEVPTGLDSISYGKY